MGRRSTNVAAALLLAAFIAHSQLPEVEQKLAGERDHTWVFARMEVIMGGDGRCKAGETWRFSSNHEVQVRTCQNEKVVVSNERWSVAQKSVLDNVLTIGPNQYYLRFFEKSGSHYMNLRTVVITKMEPRIDKDFRLDQE